MSVGFLHSDEVHARWLMMRERSTEWIVLWEPIISLPIAIVPYQSSSTVVPVFAVPKIKNSVLDGTLFNREIKQAKKNHCCRFLLCKNWTYPTCAILCGALRPDSMSKMRITLFTQTSWEQPHIWKRPCSTKMKSDEQKTHINWNPRWKRMEQLKFYYYSIMMHTNIINIDCFTSHQLHTLKVIDNRSSRSWRGRFEWFLVTAKFFFVVRRVTILRYAWSNTLKQNNIGWKGYYCRRTQNEVKPIKEKLFVCRPFQEPGAD